MTEPSNEQIRSHAEVQDLMRRRGVIAISPSILTDILGLPEGYVVTGVHPDFHAMAIFVAVASPDLDRVPENAQAPRLGDSVALVKHVDDEGKTWMRLEWPGDPA